MTRRHSVTNVASIEKAEREFLRFKARQLLAVKKGHLKASGYKRGHKPPDIKREHQAPMKLIKNLLGLNTVEAIFDRLLPTVVNGKQVHPSLSAEKTIASTDKEKQVENNKEALAEKILTSGSPLELCNQENQKDSVKRAAVKKFLDDIFRSAFDKVRSEQLSASCLTQSLPKMTGVGENPESLENASVAVEKLVAKEEIKLAVLSESLEKSRLIEEDFFFDKMNVEPNLKPTANQEIVPRGNLVTEKDFEDPGVLKDDQIPLVLVNWDDVMLNVDAEIKIGPEVKGIKDKETQAFSREQEEIKDEELSLVLVNWDDVMVNVDAEIKIGPEVEEIKEKEAQAFPNEQEDDTKVKDDDHVMVSWDQVEVSVDAQIKNAPEAKQAKGSLTEASAEHDRSVELNIEGNKEIEYQTSCPLIDAAVEKAVVQENYIPLTLVKWEEVKLSVDAEVKLRPLSKEDNLDQDSVPVEGHFQVEQTDEKTEDDIQLTFVEWENVTSVESEVECAHNVKSENYIAVVKTTPMVEKNDKLSDRNCQMSKNLEIMQEHDIVKKRKGNEIQENLENQEAQEGKKSLEDQEDQVNKEARKGKPGQALSVYKQQFLPESEEPVATGGKERAVAMGDSYALTCSPVDVSPMATASTARKDSGPIAFADAIEEPANTRRRRDDTTNAAMGNCFEDNESNPVAVRGNFSKNKRANDDGNVGEKAHDIIEQEIDNTRFLTRSRNGQEIGENEIIEEDDEEVLIHYFIPVFIDKGKDILDHTSRDESTPLAENEVLDLLSTVMTDDEILDQIGRSDSSCSLEDTSNEDCTKQMHRQIHDPQDEKDTCKRMDKRMKSPTNGNKPAKNRNVDALNVESVDCRPSEDTETSHKERIKRDDDDVDDTEKSTGETTIARPSDDELSVTAKIVHNDATHGVRGSGDFIGGPANGTISQMISMGSLEEDPRCDGTEGVASVARPGNASNSKTYASSRSNENMTRKNGTEYNAFTVRPDGESTSKSAIKYAAKKESTKIEREHADGDNACVRHDAPSASEDAEYRSDVRNHELKVKNDKDTHNSSLGEGHKIAEEQDDGRVYSIVRGGIDTVCSIVPKITTEKNRGIPLQEDDGAFLNSMDETSKNQPKDAAGGLQPPIKELDSKDIGIKNAKNDGMSYVYDKDKNKTKKDVSRIQKEYDTEDAIQKFNNVRQVLGLDGPVSTALVYKFLRAREFDVDEATYLYKNFLSLRRVYYNSDLSPLKDPLQQELFSGSFTILDARDETGAAIAIVTAQLLSNKCGHEVVLNSIYLQLEETIKSTEIQQNGIILIYNFSYVSSETCDVHLCAKILELFQSAYPVRMKKVFIVSPPFWIEPEMRLYSDSFRHPKNRKNIHIVKQSRLKDYLPVTCISRGLGGECQANPLKLAEMCISSYKERVGLVDSKDVGASNDDDGKNTMPREDPSDYDKYGISKTDLGKGQNKSAENIDDSKNSKDLGLINFNIEDCNFNIFLIAGITILIVRISIVFYEILRECLERV